MASVLRGEIRWAELDPTRGNEQQGTRPVLVISHDVFNDRSGTVLAMAITSHGTQVVQASVLAPHWSDAQVRPFLDGLRFVP